MPLIPAPVVDAVTFASRPHELFLPARDVARELKWKLDYDDVVQLAKLKGHTLSPLEPQLSDGTILISTKDLVPLGARIAKDRISSGQHAFVVRIGAKRVSVDLKSQILRAWQGDRLVYQWPVSSGREGKETPAGDFKAQKKEPMHISTIYGSPMPFSVHINGNIFIHGSDRFSSLPGSHGCIRLPFMETRNVAEEFYNWIEIGVPVSIRGSFRFARS